MTTYRGAAGRARKAEKYELVLLWLRAHKFADLRIIQGVLQLKKSAAHSTLQAMCRDGLIAEFRVRGLPVRLFHLTRDGKRYVKRIYTGITEKLSIQTNPEKMGLRTLEHDLCVQRVTLLTLDRLTRLCDGNRDDFSVLSDYELLHLKTHRYGKMKRRPDAVIFHRPTQRVYLIEYQRNAGQTRDPANFRKLVTGLYAQEVFADLQRREKPPEFHGCFWFFADARLTDLWFQSFMSNDREWYYGTGVYTDPMTGSDFQRQMWLQSRRRVYQFDKETLCSRFSFVDASDLEAEYVPYCSRALRIANRPDKAPLQRL